MDGFIGEIRIWPCPNYPPRNWFRCEGQVLYTKDYKSLFDLLGTRYGGNGTTTFALPDMRTRTPVHPGKMGAGIQSELGRPGGIAKKSIDFEHLPRHQHTIKALVSADSAAGDTNSPSEGFPASTGITDGEYNTTHDGSFMAADALDVKVMAGSGAGAFWSLDNYQPYLVVHFIICFSGTMAPRPA